MDEIKKQYTFEYSDRFAFEDDENRHLWLNEDVTDDLISTFVYSIFRYNKKDKDIPVEDRKPIFLYINTPGGDVYSGYSLISAIQCSKTPVYTINLGICYSMGFLVYLASKNRYAMPYATFLIHDGSTFSYDSFSKAKDRMDFEAGSLAECTKRYVLNNTQIDEKTYDENLRVEWYMFANEAQAYGIVDKIIGMDCEMDEVL